MSNYLDDYEMDALVNESFIEEVDLSFEEIDPKTFSTNYNLRVEVAIDSEYTSKEVLTLQAIVRFVYNNEPISFNIRLVNLK